ncbi:hypothetical protein DFH09DRAFT_1328819 [Mycena vulgaris]|nr:hypothetical protein DFH09DRAFT_1328819 [Mycena vulgaris]
MDLGLNYVPTSIVHHSCNHCYLARTISDSPGGVTPQDFADYSPNFTTIAPVLVIATDEAFETDTASPGSYTHALKVMCAPTPLDADSLQTLTATAGVSVFVLAMASPVLGCGNGFRVMV